MRKSSTRQLRMEPGNVWLSRKLTAKLLIDVYKRQDIIHEGFNMRGITITFENTESKPVDKSAGSEYICANVDTKVLVTALYPYGTIFCGRCV